MKPIDRLIRKVEKRDDGCWIWTGGVNSSGYGTIKIDKKNYTVHRLSYIIHNGIVPSSKLDVMHLCDNKRCINPDHLRVGTRKENILDFISKGGTYARIGDDNIQAKITDDQFSEIKERLASGEQKTALAREFGITRQSINGRIRRENGRR